MALGGDESFLPEHLITANKEVYENTFSTNILVAILLIINHKMFYVFDRREDHKVFVGRNPKGKSASKISRFHLIDLTH